MNYSLRLCRIFWTKYLDKITILTRVPKINPTRTKWPHPLYPFDGEFSRHFSRNFSVFGFKKKAEMMSEQYDQLPFIIYVICIIIGIQSVTTAFSVSILQSNMSYVTFQGNSEIWSHKAGGRLVIA